MTLREKILFHQVGSPFGSPHLPQHLHKVRIKQMIGNTAQVIPIEEERPSLGNCSAGVLWAKYREWVPNDEMGIDRRQRRQRIHDRLAILEQLLSPEREAAAACRIACVGPIGT